MRSDGTSPHPTVAVILVTHNGSRWLPDLLHALPNALLTFSPSETDAASLDTATIDGAVSQQANLHFPSQRGEEQWRASDSAIALQSTASVECHLVAVDTGSVDASADLVREAAFTVLNAEPSMPFGRAVAVARTFLQNSDISPTWLWLIHDDIAPAPGCLPELIAAAESAEAAIAGPMLVSWSGSRGIIELGLQLTGAGKRVTGVDVGEVDQGQHDDDPVVHTLAVSSAAMLVRTDVWDALGGFDPALPMSGDDINFCRRAIRAGHRVVAAPRAKVRHAAAMSRGARPHSRSSRPARDARLSAIHLQVTHAATWAWPLVLIRMVLGTFLAAGVALLRGDVVRVRDEIDGLLRFLAHPSRVFASRHKVAAVARHAPSIERKFRIPLRQRARVASRALVAVVDIVTRVAGEQQSAPIFLDEDDEQSRPVRRELIRRLWHRPLVAIPLLVAVITGLAHAPVLFGAGPVHADLWPVTIQSGGDLWRSYLSAWHDVGRGNAAPAPTWLAFTAVLALPFGGSLSALVSFLCVFFVPLFVISFSAATRGLVRGTWPRVIAGLCVAFVPVLTAATQRADISVLVAALLLPLLARSCVSAIVSPTVSRWARVALILTAAAAYEPFLWVIAAGVALVMVCVTRQARGPALAITLTLLSPLVLLMPMSMEWLRNPQLLFMSTGALAEQPPTSSLWWQVLTLSEDQGRWWAATIAVLGAAALVRGASHSFTRNLGLAALVPLCAIVIANHVMFRIPGSIEPVHPQVAIALIAIASAAAVSIATAADGLAHSLRTHGVGSRHFAAALSVAALAVALICGGAASLDSSKSSLARGFTRELPAFVAAGLDSPERPRVVVLHPNDPGSVGFAVRSSATSLVGEDDLLRMSSPDVLLEDAIRNLVAQEELTSGVRAAAVRTLADSGVRYLAMPATGVGAQAVAGALVSAPRLRQLTTPTDGRGWWLWQVPGQPSRARIASLTHPDRLLAWPAFESAGQSDPGHARLNAATATSQNQQLLAPSVIAIADVTSHWSATVDGRPADVTRTESGTWLVDIPVGARASVVIERSDQARTLWVLLQGLVVVLVVLMAVPRRRRRDGDDS